jgi:predicted nucleic-acid-binding protein
MIGLDTNVLVRFLVQDDRVLFARAQRLLAREARRGESVLVSLLVLLETEWVLRSRYGLAKSEIADALSALLDSVELRVEDEAAVEQALFTWRDSGADFAGCLIGARNRRLGCVATATFDVRAAKVPGFIAA